MTSQIRGPTPEVQQGQKVRVIATQSMPEIIRHSTPPVLDLSQIQVFIDVGWFGITELEACLLFYLNPKGSGRVGYETKILSHLGSLGGSPSVRPLEAIEELKHMGSMYLSLPREGYVTRTQRSGPWDLPLEAGDSMGSGSSGGFTARKLGYSHIPIIVTSLDLSNIVKDAFTEMGCDVLHER